MVGSKPPVEKPQPPVAAARHFFSRTLVLTRALMSNAFLLLQYLATRPYILYRALGLHVIPGLFIKDEEPKVALDKSRRRALERCAVHILPSIVSIVIVVLNIHGYFIGSELQGGVGQDELKLGLIQFAAKIHELLIISSLGSIILHATRSEILSKDGLPLGLVVSSWSFAQISYFWSADFWGGAISHNAFRSRRWGRCLFIGIVVVGGILAVMAGPVSAVLMLPIRSEWPVGGGIGWMNGSNVELFPTEPNAEYYQDVDCTTSERLFRGQSPCPSSGLLALHHILSQGGWVSHSPSDVDVRDALTVKTIHSRPATVAHADSWTYTAHHTTAMVQDALRNIHYEALWWLEGVTPLRSPYPLHLLWAESVRMEVETKAPIVRVHCHEQTEAFSDPLANISIKFPRLEEGLSSWQPKPPGGVEDDPEPQSGHYYKTDTFDLTDHITRHIYDRGFANSPSLPLNRTEFFAEARRILVIPTDIWNNTASSLGLVILLDGDGDPEKPAPFNAVACSVDARWAKAKSVMTPLPNLQAQHDYVLGRNRVPVSVKLAEDRERWLGRLGLLPINPPDDGLWNMIRLHESWYHLWSPVLPSDILPAPDPFFRGGVSQSSLERILELVYRSDDLDYRGEQRTVFANILSIMFADGLSRAGLALNTNTSQITADATYEDRGSGQFTDAQARSLICYGDPKQSFPKPTAFDGHDTTQVTLRAIYTGYNLSVQNSWFSWLCVVLLLAHAAMASLHTAWVVLHGRTGSAWDTILELVALAQSSEPPGKPILANTSAGVRSLRTSGLVAWVENSQCRPEGAKKGEGRLRLVLDDTQGTRDPELRVKEDRFYN